METRSEALKKHLEAGKRKLMDIEEEAIKANQGGIASDNFIMCSKLMDRVIAKVLHEFSSTTESKMEIEKAPEEVKCQQKKVLVLSDFVRKNEKEVIRTFKVKQVTSGRKFAVRQIRVHQQHVSNLCGFHSLFNLDQAAHML